MIKNTAHNLLEYITKAGNEIDGYINDTLIKLAQKDNKDIIYHDGEMIGVKMTRTEFNQVINAIISVRQIGNNLK